MAPTFHYLALSAVLFTIGAIGVLLRRSAVAVGLAMGLMVNAALLSFAAFARYHRDAGGQVAVLLILLMAVAETIVGLSLAVALFRSQKTVDLDEAGLLKW